MPDPRVEAAISNWAPRFVANGVYLDDFNRTTAQIETWDGWLDAWVDNGRFRPEYVVGGVVSGRWASRGGGALQIPRQIRGVHRRHR